MRVHFWPIFILIITALIGAKALIHPGWYTSHDGEHQLVRQYVFDKAVKAGHIPPRFDRQLLNGLGYPLFTFTYQLPFILGEPFRLLGLSVQDTVKLVFILTYIASGLTMYLFATDLWKSKLAGLLSGFLYLWAPYRFSTLLVRASLGEHVSFVFFPLILWSLLKVKPLRLTVGAISLTSLILSHFMLTQIFILPLILFWFFHLIQLKSKLSYLIHSILIIILAAGLSAYYWLPALFLRSAVTGLNRHFYAEHFVTLKQLFYSPWGYTFSVLGPNDGMSFQIGVAQLLVVGLALLLLIKRPERLVLLFLGIFSISIFMMLSISSPLWVSLVKRYFVVDIPWRFLAVAVVVPAALAGFVITRLKSVFRITVVTGLVILALYNNRNYLRVNKYIDYPDSQLAAYRGTSNSYDEYQSVFTGQALLKRQDLPQAEVISGAATIRVQKSLPHRVVIEAQASEPSQLQVNTTYFPGWTLAVNGQVRDIKASLAEGVPRVKLEPGSHLVTLVYRQTPMMWLGNIISLISVAAVAALVL